MDDLDVEIAQLFRLDKSGAYETEASYRRAIDRAVERLTSLQQSSGSLTQGSEYLPPRALRIFVVSMIKDHALSLSEVQFRIAAAAQRPAGA